MLKWSVRGWKEEKGRFSLEMGTRCGCLEDASRTRGVGIIDPRASGCGWRLCGERRERRVCESRCRAQQTSVESTHGRRWPGKRDGAFWRVGFGSPVGGLGAGQNGKLIAYLQCARVAQW